MSHYDDAEANDEREGMINGKTKIYGGSASVLAIPRWLAVGTTALLAVAVVVVVSSSSSSSARDTDLADQLASLQTSVSAIQSRVDATPSTSAQLRAPAWSASFPPRSVIESCDASSACPGVVAWLHSHTPSMKIEDPTATAREKYLA